MQHGHSAIELLLHLRLTRVFKSYGAEFFGIAGRVFVLLFLSDDVNSEHAKNGSEQQTAISHTPS
jgi:hypothetical protein